MNRLGIRHRLLLAVGVAVALALAAMVGGFNLLLARNLSRDADNLLRARATSELTVLRAEKGKLIVADAPDQATADSYVWVYAGGRTLEAPRAGRQLNSAAQRLSSGPARFADVPPLDTRLYSQPVVIKGRRLGTVVTAVSVAPYESTRRAALLASLVLGVAVLALVLIAARWLLASALRPVARMTHQAAAWSEHELDRRFALGEPRDELTELAATLDGLLDRLATSLRREQRFSAELSHELRTPLARVIGEVDLALSRERTPDEHRAALELVRRNAVQLQRIVDTLVAAAKTQTGAARGTADAYSVVADVAAACAGLASERGVEIEVEQPPRPIRLGVDAELAERILQPVLENGCRYGSVSVHVAVARGPGGVRYTVEDDGPGVAEDERERIFEPGVRGQAGKEDGGAGAGLGLALARRLARSVAGEVDALPDSGRGRFVVWLPVG
jgi:two-component system OmpR family sensor kinase